MSAHEYAGALAAAEEYLEANPGDSGALRIKSDIYAAMGEWDRASEILEEAVSKHPGNADLLLALAVVYREKLMRSGMIGRMTNGRKSSRALERAFSIDPTHLEIRRQMVFYLVHAPGIAGGDKDRGKKIALETVQMDEVEGRIQLAVACRERGEIDQSVAAFRRAIELDPQRGEAYFMLGHTYLENGDYEAAERTFGEYAGVAPEDPRPYDGLGDCFGEMRQSDKAIEQYLRALEKDPWYGDARYKLARQYKRDRWDEEAAYHYEQLLERNPGHVDAGNARKELRKINRRG
jgi:tetratricopeptide (TPR) repeat protein